MSSTALQLVNRLLIRIGENKVNDSTTFSSHAGEDALEFVNEAKEQILETRVWDFDRRRDYLIVYPSLTTDTLAVISNLTLFGGTVGSSLTTTLNGDFRMRLHVSSASGFGDTSFPVEHMAYTSSPTFAGELDQSWPGSNEVTATGSLFVSEYQIPYHTVSATNTTDTGSKYRQILSVKNQEEDIQLKFVDADFDLNKWVPRAHEDLGEAPRVMYVGGKVPSTGPVTIGPIRDSMVIWPVPDEATRLDYVGVYRHPRLVAPEDTLDNVDAPAENLIVSLAAAKWFQGPGRDARTGLSLEQAVLKYVDSVHSGMKRQPNERNVLGSMDSRMRDVTEVNFGRIPDVVEGL